MSLASEDARFRAQLRQLAQAVLDATDVPGPLDPVQTVKLAIAAIEMAEESLAVAGDGVQAAAQEPVAMLQAELSAESSPPLPELTLGRSVPPVDASIASVAVLGDKATGADIPMIIKRCQLKAEGARWAAARQRLMSGGATFSIEIEPKDRDIITRAKAIPDCFLWMCHSSGPSPTDLKLYENVAGCFETMADALLLLKQIEDEDLNQSDFEQGLDLLAEAQSALRVAIDTIDGKADNDQIQAFDWLRNTTGKKQIVINRFMRANDPADPTRWADLCARIDALDSRVQKSHRQAKHRKKLLGKIRYKLSEIASGPQIAEGNWPGIIGTVEELLAGGLPASNRELRELLAPAIDSLPEIPDLPKGFQLVVGEIDRFLATCPTTATSATTIPNAEVEKVAGLLEGNTLVLIGGDNRPHAKEALKAAFRLSDLIWIATREHESLEGFKPIVSKSEVAAVLLAIRWSSHSHGDIKEHCDRAGKPLVRIPGGYNPNQVASQILQQCSVQLETRKSLRNDSKAPSSRTTPKASG